VDEELLLLAAAAENTRNGIEKMLLLLLLLVAAAATAASANGCRYAHNVNKAAADNNQCVGWGWLSLSLSTCVMKEISAATVAAAAETVAAAADTVDAAACSACRCSALRPEPAVTAAAAAVAAADAADAATAAAVTQSCCASTILSISLMWRCRSCCC